MLAKASFFSCIFTLWEWSFKKHNQSVPGSVGFQLSCFSQLSCLHIRPLLLLQLEGRWLLLELARHYTTCCHVLYVHYLCSHVFTNEGEKGLETPFVLYRTIWCLWGVGFSPLSSAGTVLCASPAEECTRKQQCKTRGPLSTPYWNTTQQNSTAASI